MSGRAARLHGARSLALLAAGVVGGCEVVALSVDSSTGRIVVRLEEDGAHRGDEYRMRVRQTGEPEQIVAVRSGIPLELTVRAAAPAELTLLIPPGCRTLGRNPRTVEPAADGTVDTRFTVRCTS